MDVEKGDDPEIGAIIVEAMTLLSRGSMVLCPFGRS